MKVPGLPVNILRIASNFAIIIFRPSGLFLEGESIKFLKSKNKLYPNTHNIKSILK